MNSNQNPTFNAFVNEMFVYVFDGLITGGTKEMKVRLMLTISTAAQISGNGGFRKE
jgi:hypothetical protein